MPNPKMKLLEEDDLTPEDIEAIRLQSMQRANPLRRSLAKVLHLAPEP